MKTWRIIDEVSGEDFGTQTWPDDFAPIVRAGFKAVASTGGFAIASGSFTATGAGSAIVLRGEFNLSIWGTFTGTLVLERSFDGGTTWINCTWPDRADDGFSKPASVVCSELEAGVQYRVRCTSYSLGTARWRLSQ